MKGLWKTLSTFFIIALTFAFLRWYIKGHVGKYFILFWLNTILAIILFAYQKNHAPEHDPTPGYVYWERNVKSW